MVEEALIHDNMNVIVVDWVGGELWIAFSTHLLRLIHFYKRYIQVMNVVKFVMNSRL